MGTTNLHQEPQDGQSQLEAPPGSFLSHQGWDGAEGPHSNTYIYIYHIYITGEISIPLLFSFSSLTQRIHFSGNFSKGFMGGSWFQDEPCSEQVEKPARAVVNGDLCS